MGEIEPRFITEDNVTPMAPVSKLVRRPLETIGWMSSGEYLTNYWTATEYLPFLQSPPHCPGVNSASMASYSI